MRFVFLLVVLVGCATDGEGSRLGRALGAGMQETGRSMQQQPAKTLKCSRAVLGPHDFECK